MSSTQAPAPDSLLWEVCMHEAGHFVAAEQLGAHPRLDWSGPTPLVMYRTDELDRRQAAIAALVGPLSALADPHVVAEDLWKYREHLEGKLSASDFANVVAFTGRDDDLLVEALTLATHVATEYRQRIVQQAVLLVGAARASAARAS